MHRRLSTIIRGSRSHGESSNSDVIHDYSSDTESKITTPTIRETPQAPPSLKIKRVDYYYSWWARNWKYRNTSAKVAVESIPVGSSSNGNDPWKDFLFVVVRTIPQQENVEVSIKLVIKSPYLLKACKDVIRSWPGISWNADPLELDPEIFLIFYDQFIAYNNSIKSKKSATQEETYISQAIDVLINTLANDYKGTLAKLQRHTAHGEIQWDLLPYLLVPRTLFVARCNITGQPRLFKLREWVRNVFDGRQVFQLTLESVDIVDKSINQSVTVGRVLANVTLKPFRGTQKINSLDMYPITFFNEKGMKEEGLRQMAIERGKKWFSLFGIHHVQYEGVAALRMCERAVRQHVTSRIMIDRATFQRVNPNYTFPTPAPDANAFDDHVPPPRPPGTQLYDAGGWPVTPPITNNTDAIMIQSNKSPYETLNMEDYSEEDYLLASTVVYGFSLADKVWIEFSVDNIQPVQWNDSAFDNLVLPPGRKDLLKSLIEAHHKELNFDDFIRGKGHGLVINLFGPPGVGKTFSAEATSEHVKRPLYVVGAGDLGTAACTLDTALEKVFDLATVWNALVLIDEADVFLEQRSLHDLERNAMVAVFLRHVEYYRGILFLTTNRVKAFDEAFLSRIHVALHFKELSHDSKIQVWNAFLKKVGALSNSVDTDHGITEEQVEELAKKNINGRQIKNAVRTAQSLASARGEKLTHPHIAQTLDAMEEFTREFKSSCIQ